MRLQPTAALASSLLVAACATTPRPQPDAPRVSQAAASLPAPTTFDAARLGGMRWRMVGPARGGRVTAATGVAQQPHTFYMGSTGGGVWKTEDAGQNWRNVTDGFLTVGSIGALEVADSDPNVVWVGTGSEGLRSNVSVGKGLWRSTDAGKTWTHAGLADSKIIGAIVIHPTNPDIVYVAALGDPFAPGGEQRGVFRTRDAGRSWTRVLTVSDSTGAVDLELKPDDPNVVYATMWRAERKPWTIISGAREGGVYKSTDGGDNWKKLTAGLPNDLVGKADLAVSPAAPNRLYVLIEAKPGGGLYRSDDAGETFVVADTTTRGLITRPFYYTNVDADPTNADIVYVGTEGFYKSTDAGKTWRTMPTPHGDNHELWINPRDPRIMLQTNDGGANVTLDGGRTWSTQYNQPTAEIYQVYVDDQIPYRLYGAQQDNSTLIVPSLPLGGRPDDPIQSIITTGPGCETGPIMPHPTNPDTVYGSCKGQYSRMSLRTGQEKQYWVGMQSLYGNPGKDLIYRFQRVSPMEVSPHDPGVIHYGSQYVHRTRDEGVTWERISPDLTWNPPERQQTSSGEPITLDVTGEEYYSTLYAIRESPIARGVIWTGANDGPFHVTRDDGRTWTNVTPRDLAPGGRVQNIEPSPHRAGTAYYAVLRYLLGDYRPYIYRTDDYGQTWKLLTTGTNGIPADEPTRVVREDPERAGLLYAGTEFGVYVSYDNGGRWHPLQLELPRTPITDMKVHQGDLVLSTQGRSFWILDDLTPIRQLRDEVAAAPVHLFTPREALRLRYSAGFGGLESARSNPADPQYRPMGAVIDYWLSGDAARGPVTLEVVDSAGRVIRNFSSEAVGERTQPPAEPGMRAPTMERVGTPRLPAAEGHNRFTWDYALPGPWDADARRSGRNGPLALPGRYTLRLTAAGRTVSQPLVVRADPRSVKDGVTPAVLADQLAHNLQARDLVTDMNRLVADVRAARAAASNGSGDALAALEQRLVGETVRYGRPGLQTHVTYLYRGSLGADQAVGRDAVERLAVLRKEVDAARAELARITGAAQ